MQIIQQKATVIVWTCRIIFTWNYTGLSQVTCLKPWQLIHLSHRTCLLCKRPQSLTLLPLHCLFTTPHSLGFALFFLTCSLEPERNLSKLNRSILNWILFSGKFEQSLQGKVDYLKDIIQPEESMPQVITTIDKHYCCFTPIVWSVMVRC